MKKTKSIALLMTFAVLFSAMPLPVLAETGEEEVVLLKEETETSAPEEAPSGEPESTEADPPAGESAEEKETASEEAETGEPERAKAEIPSEENASEEAETGEPERAEAETPSEEEETPSEEETPESESAEAETPSEEETPEPESAEAEILPEETGEEEETGEPENLIGELSPEPEDEVSLHTAEAGETLWISPMLREEDTTLWLVAIEEDPLDERQYLWDGEPMLWSDAHSAWVSCVWSPEEPGSGNLSEVFGEGEMLEPDADLNDTGWEDLNDVQYLYSICRTSGAAGELPRELCLRCDLNGDGVIDLEDVQELLLRITE